jgi:plastocyanin
MTTCPRRSVRRTRAVAATVALLAVAAVGGCAAPGAPVEPADAVVTVRDLAFTPREVTVAVGGTVEWRFDDAGLYHHVSSTEGFFENAIGGDGTYRFTFDEPGTYAYDCSIHPYMVGTVVVTA